MAASAKIATTAEEERRLTAFLSLLPDAPEGWECREVQRVNVYESPAIFVCVYTNGIYRVAFRANPEGMAISMSRRTGCPLLPGDTVKVAKLFFPDCHVIAREVIPGLVYFVVDH